MGTGRIWSWTTLTSWSILASPGLAAIDATCAAFGTAAESDRRFEGVPRQGDPGTGSLWVARSEVTNVCAYRKGIGQRAPFGGLSEGFSGGSESPLGLVHVAAHSGHVDDLAGHGGKRSLADEG